VVGADRKVDEGAGCSAGVAADYVGGEPFGVCGVYGVLVVRVLWMEARSPLFPVCRVLVLRSISYYYCFWQVF
jgi:hypothetical protein